MNVDELLNINVFQQDFVINGNSYKAALQLYVLITDRHYVRILLLQSKNDIKEMILLALDSDNEKIVPIPLNMLNKVIKEILHVPFPDKLGEYINGLSEREHKAIGGVQFVKVSNNIIK